MHGIPQNISLSVYFAVVISTLVCACETWTSHCWHIKELEKFHHQHLGAIMHIKL